jgi:hypothetical protein
MKANPFNYVLVHFSDGDTAGHASGWGSSPYNNALITVDGYLGRIFNLVTGTPALQGKTDIILTADHGGKGTDHSMNTEHLNYTVPLYVWGPDAQAGMDLYGLNQHTRVNPLTTRPDYTVTGQPIRNGELANLALDLLGLRAVPGSTINSVQDLSITSPSAYSECGSDNGKALTAQPVNLCEFGVASAVSGAGPWAWSCTNGGARVSCTASLLMLPVITTTSPLPSGTVSVPYTQNLVATGGTAPYSWSLFNGSLPLGLSLSSAGLISGTPTAGGISRFTSRVEDAAGYTADKSLSLTISVPLMITTGSPLPNAIKKVVYSAQLVATGGSSPYIWSISSGKLPAGLSLNSVTGVISGRTNKSGISTFMVKVLDTKGISAIKALSLTVE